VIFFSSERIEFRFEQALTEEIPNARIRSGSHRKRSRERSRSSRIVRERAPSEISFSIRALCIKFFSTLVMIVK
jgi:hypothetical protein